MAGDVVRNTSKDVHTSTAAYGRPLNKEMQKSLVNPNTFIPHRLLGLQNVLEFHSVRMRHNDI